MRWSALVSAALILAGCATSRPPTPFPTAMELGRLAAVPLPAFQRRPVAAVERLELVGPPGETIGATPAAPEGPLGEVVARFAASRAGLVVATAEHACVARHLGQLRLAKPGDPPEELKLFLEARCGVAASTTSAWLEGEVPAEVDEAALVARWAPDLARSLPSWVGPGVQQLGLWLGRSDGRAVLIVVSSSPRVRLDPVPMIPVAGGLVTLTGELLIPAAALRGIVTRGPYGHEECVADPAVRLPAFSLRCQTAPEDPEARIELFAFPAGRILGPVVLDLRVWPAGILPVSWERPPPAEPALATGAGHPEALLAALNHARAAAGQRPLTDAARESSVATRLAPHYFAAVLGVAEETIADKVVLGLRAGWDVEGLIQEGTFASAWQDGSPDDAALAAKLLARPSGRAALLRPDLEQVALGTVELPGGGLALVASAYSFFEVAAHEAVATAIFERLTAARAERGLPPPTWLPAAAPLAVRAASSVQGGLSPDAALGNLLSLVVAQTRRAASGAWAEASSPAEVPFHEDLLRPGPLAVALGVSWWKPEGEPWGRLVVLFVYSARGGMTALPEPPRG